MKPNPEIFDLITGDQKWRLSDAILVAFHQACNQSDVEVAWELLNVLDAMAIRSPTGKFRKLRSIDHRTRCHPDRVAGAKPRAGGASGGLASASDELMKRRDERLVWDT
jgi:hypothetical protein